MDVTNLTFYCLNSLFNLSVIYKLQHWNCSGCNFLSKHEFFDELSAFCLKSIDELAEVLLAQNYCNEIPPYIFTIDLVSTDESCFSCSQCLTRLGEVSNVDPVCLVALNINTGLQSFIYKLKRMNENE